jgi:putative transposase
MYDYRRLTPEEREAVVEARRARGFPLHRPPHTVRETGWYLVTAATYEHRCHFAAPNELKALELRLLEELTAFQCAAWVVLPNHYHALVCAPGLAELGTALGRVHGRASRYANQRDGTPGRTVWYKYSDRAMRSDRHFWATVHYIVHNPVKHGYVDDSREWPWGSTAELIGAYGAGWHADLASAYPLADYGDGWDVF